MVLAHACTQISATFRDYVEPYFYLGSWGVALFFMCSGFILPVSLERQGSLACFWARRFFRLFPLYWISVVATILIGNREAMRVLAGPPERASLILAANLTMFQAFLGFPHLMALYWTLTLELLFYILISLLFLLRLSTRLTWATLALILGMIGAELTVAQPFAFSYSTHLLLILVGLVVYRRHSGKIGQRLGAAIVLLTLLMLALPVLVDRRDPFGQLSWVLAQIAACVCFGCAYLMRSRPIHPALRYLGQISYSIYLMHPIVLDLIPRQASPALTLLIWLAGVLLLASATHRWIERPMIAWGQRLTRARQ